MKLLRRATLQSPPRFSALAMLTDSAPGAEFNDNLPYWVLGVTLRGECEHGPPAGPRFNLEARRICLIKPWTPQRWRVTGSRNWRCVSFLFEPRAHWLELLDWSAVSPGFLLLPPCGVELWKSVSQEALAACQQSRTGLADAADFVCNSLERLLLHCRRRLPPRKASRRDARIEAAVLYLNEHLDQPGALSGLTTHCHLSRAQLYRLFRQEMGVSPVAYWNRQRLNRARQLLRISYLSIKQVAFQLGFRDYKYFSRCFAALPACLRVLSGGGMSRLCLS